MAYLTLYITMIFISVMLVLTLKIKNKSQILYLFIGFAICMLLDSFGVLLEILFIHSALITRLAIIMNYIGVIFMPVAILLMGIIFARSKIRFSWHYQLLLIVPVLSVLILVTNDMHHLFFVKYSPRISESIPGQYFYVHAIYSYLTLLSGMYYLVYFSIKNSGFFSKQAILVVLGTIVALGVNVISSLNQTMLPLYSVEVSFTFWVLCFWLAIVKFGFTNILPVAQQTIMDHISDSVITVDEYYDIIDFNRTFMETFKAIYPVKRKGNLINFLDAVELRELAQTDFMKLVETAFTEKRSVYVEQHITIQKFDRYFSVEITPIYSKENYVGTVILFRDITELKRNQEILTEQERLVSLGHMIGGIAHNLKTPIMSLAGGLEALKELILEYQESIDDGGVTKEDHHQIADEMYDWAKKISPYLTYMSDLIATVKEQAIQLNVSTSESFTLEELVKRIELLMRHNLKKNCIQYHTDFEIDMDIELKGEINNLVQVFNNLFNNAIEAYNDQGGGVDFKIAKNETDIVFSIRDYGKGIPPEVQQNLFKSMVTTKGKKGTGLGLYMSNATIKGKFGGEIRFETEVGKGTTFYVSIPYLIKMPA